MIPGDGARRLSDLRRRYAHHRTGGAHRGASSGPDRARLAALGPVVQRDPVKADVPLSHRQALHPRSPPGLADVCAAAATPGVDLGGPDSPSVRLRRPHLSPLCRPTPRHRHSARPHVRASLAYLARSGALARAAWRRPRRPSVARAPLASRRRPTARAAPPCRLLAAPIPTAAHSGWASGRSRSRPLPTSSSARGASAARFKPGVRSGRTPAAPAKTAFIVPMRSPSLSLAPLRRRGGSRPVPACSAWRYPRGAARQSSGQTSSRISRPGRSRQSPPLAHRGSRHIRPPSSDVAPSMPSIGLLW